MNINLQEFIEVNGANHYLYHKGEDTDNKVMLFLHGGPGSSEANFAYTMQDKWESVYTVVHYDQRGAGKTLKANKNIEKPTFEMLIEDALEIIKYVKKKYNKEKITLFGHSFGSLLASILVKKYPEHFEMYISAGQFLDMVKNEDIAFEKLQEVIKTDGTRSDMKKLQKIEEDLTDELDMKKIAKIRSLQEKYGLAVGAKTLLPLLLKSPIFKVSDIFMLMKAFKVNSKIFEFISTFSLLGIDRKYEIPVIYMIGEKDFQTPYKLAEEYFDEIDAPYKRKFYIKNAGHFSMIDGKKQFEEYIIEISKMNFVCN